MTRPTLPSRQSLQGASTQCLFSFTAAGLALALAVTAAHAQTAGEPKPASPTTLEFNKNSTATLPWSDKADFANAKRGLIAPLPDNGVIKNNSGRVVWDLSRYTSFIQDGAAAPDTVNPSLWRMSQLLMDAGLYEVVPGVYQVRGADLSNLTIIEGEQGITIYDPLISAETAHAALDLYYQNRPRKPVVAVVYSHSHIDHAGGVRGVVDEADVKSGKVKIYAGGFLREFRCRESLRRHRNGPPCRLHVRQSGRARPARDGYRWPWSHDVQRDGHPHSADRPHHQNR